MRPNGECFEELGEYEMKEFIHVTFKELSSGDDSGKCAIRKGTIVNYYVQGGQMWVFTDERGYKVKESYDEVKAMMEEI